MKKIRRRTAFLEIAGALVLIMLAGASLTAAGPSGAAPGRTPTPASPTSAVSNDSRAQEPLESLAAIVNAENREWENVTFWEGGVLGDSALAVLRIAPEPGERFPDFDMELLDGSVFHLADSEGPVLLNFWASWCGPCRLELPYLIEMAADVQAPFSIVLANVWDETESYRQFARAEFPETLPSGRLEDGQAAEFGFRGIPISVLLNAELTIQAVHVGNITPGVVDFFYNLAARGAQLPPEFVDLPATQLPMPAEALLTEVEQANRATNSQTFWRGGLIGEPGGPEVALQAGEKLPGFGLMTQRGEPFRLDLAGGPVLLNFWASWCGPCAEEFPLLVEASANSNLPFGIVYVNVWDDEYSAERFLAEYPPELLAVIDRAGQIPPLYHLEFIPVSVLIDGEGVIVLIQSGPVNTAVLEFAAALIREAQPVSAP